MTKAEKETVIVFNEAEDTAIVYTHSSRIKKEIEKLLEKKESGARLVKNARTGAQNM